ncbi:bifunctional diguanylate cyclase/phosphodiesterase [Sulfurimonas lithotrophica]|uniref:Bifunctional diguanylate cyclase/phosphodiesterase n=1 Tax=Sulfurimonas lithotrophica TaxID=2590022 RepID=A0A5P8P3Y1_9BACT|nr:bifunctional diguanylate cyclase/phosphodiesterase [Sulfurimonas lithotrophica]QFR50321.1 bifunctional diguanylate cyclase/phosphodiesterase [Sulfurimonas lithotrophica]
MFKSLKNFIFTTNALLISILFIVVFIFTTYLHTTLVQKEAIKHADIVSNQVFSSMYQVMKKGWGKKDIDDFINSLDKNFKNSNFDITIHRSYLIDELFGKAFQEKSDNRVRNVFQTGQKYTFTSFKQIRNTMPLLAKKDCLTCHTNAKENDVLGVIDIEQDLINIINDTFLEYIYFLLTIIPIFIFASYMTSKYSSNKILFSLDKFREKVEKINRVEDLSLIDEKHCSSKSFKEINYIIKEVNNLSEKLKNIAVDKELLEFEVKLLDKLIITSDMIKDWRVYIKELLVDINLVMETTSLITIFRVGDEHYEIDIFWYGVPDDGIKRNIESYIAHSIENDESFDAISDYEFKHNIAYRDHIVNNDEYQNFDHRTKTLFLESPKIGGIVGISVNSIEVYDSVKNIVLDSILTTMANLVGSIKAIDKYTNDLEFYAAHDPLTGLFNQRIFMDMMDNEIHRADRNDYPFALMVIDCDNFKPINDRYGHTFGDKFLQEFSKVLSEMKRAEDILSRYGGDEFTLILPNCDIAGAKNIGDKITKRIEDFRLETPEGDFTSVTVSIGVSIYPHHATTTKELFIIADGMMYKSKENGKNCIELPTQSDISDIIKEKNEKSTLLLKAVSNNKIVPYFQPIQSSATGDIEINELLMRIEIDGKIISAKDFIEVAENMSLINRMDIMVIENAFRKIQDEKYEGLLFINLSPKSIIVGDYMRNIIDLILKYNISKDKIVFEITERETVKNFTILEKFVLNLKSEGFKFAIDDFGSGFSSFHYIKKFPIDYLKIDGEFLININKDAKDKAFVHSIITLAKDLGVKTVAEYIENEEIKNTAIDMGIDYLQGYHIGRPKRDVKNIIE